MDMRYLVPTLIALCVAITRFGGAPIARLTLSMAERAADHQQHMMKLGQLNRALIGARGSSGKVHPAMSPNQR